MSKQIITDYMAGKIGDKYYESIGGKLEYIAEIGAIDDNDNNQRYKLESNDHCLSWSMKECFDHFEREAPDLSWANCVDDKRDIELPDGTVLLNGDGKSPMERITDIKKVKPGDIEVTKSGNRYKVVVVDRLSGSLTLHVAIPELNGSNAWLHDSSFAYALRPNPKVPTEPGLYFDSEKDVWELDSENNRILLRRNGRYGKYGYGRKGLDSKYAPYSRIDLGGQS